MKPSYLQQQDVFVISKAGLGSDELAQLYAEGITDTEHGESIMDLLFKHTSTKDIVWFNPQTAYSFEFANYFSPELIKDVYNDLYGDGYVPLVLLANLTKQARSMNKLKKGLNNTLVEYYYHTAYDILKFAKDNAKVYDVPYLRYVDLDRLSKANTVALLLTRYNNITEFYKQYKRANPRFKTVMAVPKLDDLGNPIMRQVTEGLDRTYTERMVIPTGSWKKVKRVVPTRVSTKLGFNPYTRKHFEYQKFIPRHTEHDLKWVPGEDTVREVVINPPKVHEVAAYDTLRIPVYVSYPEAYTKLDVFEQAFYQGAPQKATEDKKRLFSIRRFTLHFLHYVPSARKKKISSKKPIRYAGFFFTYLLFVLYLVS